MGEGTPAALALAVTALAALLLSWVATPTPPVSEGPGWHLTHEDSVAAGDGWQETFRLDAVPSGSWQQAQVVLDGRVAEGSWDGPIGECARFVTTQPSLDFLVPMALVVDGDTVWEGTYGSGSGTPYDHPCRGR